MHLDNSYAPIHHILVANEISTFRVLSQNQDLDSKYRRMRHWTCLSSYISKVIRCHANPGGKGMNFVELGTANGASGLVIVLLFNTNVTVCGSIGALDGVVHTTLLPTLTCICCGLYP